MDMNKTYTKVKERLDDNICDLLKRPNMSLEDLKFLGESIDVLKDISIIEGMEDYSEEIENGYSETSRDARRMTPRNRSMAASYEQGYIDGMSHERGRSPHTGRFVSRDGHHTTEEEMRMANASGKRYYLDTNVDSRSGHSVDDRIIAAMEKMYDDAGSEHERLRIDEIIKHIRTTGV